MPIPVILEKILKDLDENEINDTILNYYKSFGSKPKMLNDLIKAYLNVVVQEKIYACDIINDNNVHLYS